MFTVTQPFPPVGVTLAGHPRIAKARDTCSPDASTELALNSKATRGGTGLEFVTFRFPDSS